MLPQAGHDNEEETMPRSPNEVPKCKCLEFLQAVTATVQDLGRHEPLKAGGEVVPGCRKIVHNANASARTAEALHRIGNRL